MVNTNQFYDMVNVVQHLTQRRIRIGVFLAVLFIKGSDFCTVFTHFFDKFVFLLSQIISPVLGFF